MTFHSNLRGVACMVAAAGTFVANDTCMKLAMADAPPLQVLVMRGVAACIWCLPLLLALGYGRQITHVANRWVLLRCVCEVAAILSFIFALRHMAIADITAIVQIAPLLVLIGGSLIWRERIGPVRMVFIALGIAGALMVAQPGSSTASPFAIFGFTTAMGAAARDIVTRKVPRNIPALVVTFATLLIVMLCAFAGSAIFETWVPPSARNLGLMAIAGLFLMCGHFFIFLAFRFASARIVAPFNYSFTIWAVLSGFLVFGDVPDGLAISGMALIVATGLAIILFEGRVRQGPLPSPDNTQVISN